MGAEAAAHAERCARLVADRGVAADSGPWGLAKTTSNLFRDPRKARSRRLDLGEFVHVCEVDVAAGWVDVEGSTTYEALVDATLLHGVMPAVVPQLKTITVGGALAGVGIEATSFGEGLVHQTLLELEVLLPGGAIVVCTRDNEHSDLFHGFANSYGTLGYALRARLRTRPVKPYVRVLHVRERNADAFFESLARCCDERRADFVDGVVFASDSFVLNVAKFVDLAPWLSDYGFERIYYRSLLEDDVDYLSVKDYLWRWDTDWFWCSRNFGAERPWLRRLVGRTRLNSRTYSRLMRWNSRWGLTRRWARLRGLHVESVIQDVDIPLPRAGEFLAFLQRDIGILPIWICPLRGPGGDVFPMYRLAPQTLYVNFGFWDVVGSRVAHEPGHFNRLVEREVLHLGGIKSLYSESFFTRQEFADAYGGDEYEALKRRYDPSRRLLGLYEKCVQNG
jgi:FAD/FMN-containing dehydrogenase